MNIRQTIAQWFYSPGAYGLWLALDDVENWKIEENRAYYKYEAGQYSHQTTYVACMWIGNGALSFNGHDRSPKFLGLVERHFLWRKFKQINNRRMLYRFTRLEEPK